MSSEGKMLNEILERKSNQQPSHPLGKIRKASRRDDMGVDAQSEDESENTYGKMIQWTSPDGERFFPAGAIKKNLSPGVYDIKESPQTGLYFEKVPVNTQDLINFPDSKQESILKEIENFWTRKDAFKNRGDKAKILYKRGICLWGPPGSGKTCLVQMIVKDVTERGGICVIFGHPKLFVSGMRIFRQIHPDTKVVVLMEDIDSILENYEESDVLNILDGVNVLEDVVFLATTNYPERLGHRIINRPSRFDKRHFIDHPNDVCRRIYLEHLLSEKEIKERSIDLEQWVEDSKGFSMAHIKELFVAVVILGDKYENAIKTLQEMKEPISSEDSRKALGFGA